MFAAFVVCRTFPLWMGTSSSVRRKMMNTTSKAVLVPAAFAAAVLCSASYAGELKPLLHFTASEAKADLKAMEGKRVLGKSGELLGHIGKVDEQAKTAELKTPSGAIVARSVDLLTEDGDHLSAPMSRGDVIAMIDKPGETPSLREAGVIPTP